jgi:ATP-dependent Clp protease ATP-binding subunit ClpB
MSYDPNQCTSQVNKSVQEALDFASENSNIEVVPLHLAWVLFNDDNGLPAQIAIKSEVKVEDVKAAIKKHLKKLSKQNPPPNNISPNNSFMKVLKAASKLAKAQNDSFTAVDHLLIALYEDTETSAALSEAGLTKSKMEKVVKQMRGNRKTTNQAAEQTYQSLDKYATDLCKQAADGKLDPVIGRDEEIRRVIQVLQRRTKNNPILVGEPGVGKTAIVEGLAQRIIRGDVPDTLPKKIMALDMGALVAGASYKVINIDTQFSQRCPRYSNFANMCLSYLLLHIFRVNSRRD